jgi:hypothetical protein
VVPAAVAVAGPELPEELPALPALLRLELLLGSELEDQKAVLAAGGCAVETRVCRTADHTEGSSKAADQPRHTADAARASRAVQRGRVPAPFLFARLLVGRAGPGGRGCACAAAVWRGSVSVCVVSK